MENQTESAPTMEASFATEYVDYSKYQPPPVLGPWDWGPGSEEVIGSSALNNPTSAQWRQLVNLTAMTTHL